MDAPLSKPDRRPPSLPDLEPLEVNWTNIVSLMLFLIIVTAMVLSCLWLWKQHEMIPYRAECAKIPSERHAEACTTEQDCINKCSLRLYERAHLSSSGNSSIAR